MRRFALTTLLALSGPAFAAPVVWHTVPDSAIDDVPGATAQTADENRALDVAEDGIDAAKADREAARDKLAEAKREATVQRAERFAAMVNLWSARRSADPAKVDAATARFNAEDDDVTDAVDHVAWHRQHVKATKQGIGLARAEERLAKAELEMTQAQILARTDSWQKPFHKPQTYAHQVDRIEQATLSQASDVEIAQNRSEVAHQAWLASTR